MILRRRTNTLRSIVLQNVGGKSIESALGGARRALLALFDLYKDCAWRVFSFHELESFLVV